MQRPQPNPDPDPDGCWPSCDDQQPGASIRPLSHADLAALLAHHDQPERHQDPADTPGPGTPVPVLARRVRASVGRPGASATAEYRRRRTAERARWTHTLPWRVAAVLAAGVTAGLLATQMAPDLAGLLAMAAAAALGWRLRFRPSADTLAWRRGAAGERRTARLLAPLERHGWAVLHDLAIPGTQANIDHVVIGPGGVLVIDSKQYRGRLHLDQYGMVWHGRHLLISSLRKTRWQADQADEVLGIADIQVAAIVAIHGASVPWVCCRPMGSPSSPPAGCPTYSRHCRRCLGPSGWPGWPTELGCGSTPPPDRLHEHTPQAPIAGALHLRLLGALTLSISGAPAHSSPEGHPIQGGTPTWGCFSAGRYPSILASTSIRSNYAS